ncbi:MAG: transcription elongation factor GreA [Endozoicomonadaceae bacterium]|nr:transcription elongation factor GreA [Endozoicomonadaceae bacterium]
MKRFPMTVASEQALREELHRRKAVDRMSIASSIAVARELGDLKENAEYHAAREQQSFNEGRVQELEGKLSNAQIIDITAIENTGHVIFGSTVCLLNTETEEKVTYKIVGEDEADIKKGKISVSSPIARALIGKKENDVSVVKTPNGDVEYEIDKVQHI